MYFIFLLIAIVFFPTNVFSQNLPTKTVTDADITGRVFWSPDTIYILSGFVFVDSNEVLTINAGTIVKGSPGQGANASALIVAKGGRLYAEGTASKPVIFTCLSDNVDDLSDLPLDTRGQWGGVILLGRAGTNNADQKHIEGIPETEPRGEYGGSNDNDTSGVLRYVSIRYGGTVIGANNEINGLTMGAVGRGTTIEYVEVFNNADDGYEWFGGTVNCKYLISAFNGDDGFDYDQGWRGKGQFWFVIQANVNGMGNRGAEMDGGDVPNKLLQPYAIPTLYNCTYIGAGATGVNAENDLALIFRDNAGGKYYNSIFTDFKGKGISIEDMASGEDSRSRLEQGDLALQNNIWYSFGIDTVSSETYTRDYLNTTANHNRVVNPQLRGISRTNNGGLDPRLYSSSPALSDVKSVPSGDNFFTQTDYIGAFGTSNWAKDWSFISKANIMGSVADTGNVVQVSDDDIVSGQTVTWSSNKTYILNGFVFVDSGAVLNIPAGTVIKGKPGQGSSASALIVAKAGKIYAEGTALKPIIFTCLSDNVDDLNDLPLDTRGQWGGVILLGRAGTNNADQKHIEGIPETEPRGEYGGSNDNDTSGVLRYVSIRYGGTVIGANNEINGLTMGAVGRGTTIEFIEVFNNADDGYEWFGGTVNCRYLVSAFNGDDGFDYDQGWRGKGQFWFVLQANVNGMGNRGAEMDGGDVPNKLLQPYAIPTLYNCTYIGAGATGINAENDLALIFRDNAGGKYYNSIFTDFKGKGISIEDMASGEDSRSRLEHGDLVLQNNIWFKFGTDTISSESYTRDYLNNSANKNRFIDPQIRGISRTNDKRLDPRPGTGSPTLTGYATAPNDGYFLPADYVGAFGPNEIWIAGWTFLYQAGFVASRESNVVQVTDNDIRTGQTVTWTPINTYVLDGFVFVDSGAVLNIQAGTVVKGKPGQGSAASALIVAKGGRIYAQGTATLPIIFTCLADNVNDPNDLPLDLRGQWGGVILLGKAGTNNADQKHIEGIPETEPRGEYGGSNDDDTSGVLRYVSIRYGGTVIGANNEINGLTMGAVGRGTTIEFIEVFNNADDGYEWFGGTVNCKYLISAFNGDDGFDYDQGWRGKGQFWFVIQANVNGMGNRGAEMDGGDVPNKLLQPYAIPTLYNCTYIGAGATGVNAENDLALIFRDNAGGKYYNSIFTDFKGKGISIEDMASGEDSRHRLEVGDLILQSNIWFKFGTDTISSEAYTRDYLNNTVNKNKFADPKLKSISRTNDGMLDPRPATGSPALTGRADIPAGDTFFTQTSYIGAFGDQNWAADWSFISQANILTTDGGGTIIADVDDEQTISKPIRFDLSQNYPNPFNPSTIVNVSIPVSGHVQLLVYNILGQKVATLVNEIKAAGSYSITWNATNFASGIYIYRLVANGKVMTKKMTLIK